MWNWIFIYFFTNWWQRNLTLVDFNARRLASLTWIKICNREFKVTTSANLLVYNSHGHNKSEHNNALFFNLGRSTALYKLYYNYWCGGPSYLWYLLSKCAIRGLSDRSRMHCALSWSLTWSKSRPWAKRKQATDKDGGWVNSAVTSDCNYMHNRHSHHHHCLLILLYLVSMAHGHCLPVMVLIRMLMNIPIYIYIYTIIYRAFLWRCVPAPFFQVKKINYL